MALWVSFEQIQLHVTTNVDTCKRICRQILWYLKIVIYLLAWIWDVHKFVRSCADVRWKKMGHRKLKRILGWKFVIKISVIKNRDWPRNIAASFRWKRWGRVARWRQSALRASNLFLCCGRALRSKLLRIADDEKLAVWKKKESKLLCQKSHMPESHEDIARVIDGPQRSWSFWEKKRFAHQSRASCEAYLRTGTGRNFFWWKPVWRALSSPVQRTSRIVAKAVEIIHPLWVGKITLRRATAYFFLYLEPTVMREWQFSISHDNVKSAASPVWNFGWLLGGLRKANLPELVHNIISMGALMAALQCVDLCASCSMVKGFTSHVWSRKLLQRWKEPGKQCCWTLWFHQKKYSEALVLGMTGNVMWFLLSVYQTLCIFFWWSKYLELYMPVCILCIFKDHSRFSALKNETAEQCCVVQRDAFNTSTWCQSKSNLATSNAQSIGSCHMPLKKEKNSKKFTVRVVFAFCGPYYYKINS